jgi:hypothetical protein
MTLSAGGVLDRRRRTALTLGCPAAAAGPCAGEVVLRAGGLRLGRAPFAVAPGRTKVVRVTLTRAGLRALRRARSLRVRAALTARNTRPSTATFTLRPRRR